MNQVKVITDRELSSVEINQIRDIIQDYRSSARDRGHFPPVDPKSHVEAADLPN